MFFVYVWRTHSRGLVIRSRWQTYIPGAYLRGTGVYLRGTGAYLRGWWHAYKHSRDTGAFLKGTGVLLRYKYIKCKM